MLGSLACDKDAAPGGNFSLTLSSSEMRLLPGQSGEIKLTLRATAELDSPVVLSLRSPGDQPLPEGVSAAYEPEALILKNGQDSNSKLRIAALPRAAIADYPLVIYAREGSHEQSAAITLSLGGSSTRWQRPIHTDGTDVVSALMADSQGGVFIAGQTTGAFNGGKNLGDYDGYFLHYRANGALMSSQVLQTTSSDVVTGMAVDSNDNVFLSGYTYGSFPGQFPAGRADGFIAKLGPDGTLVWLRQLGTPEIDQLYGVAVDTEGGVYGVGLTEGSFPGQTNTGMADVWVVKLRPDGTNEWHRQFGSDQNDRGNAAAFGADGLYVVGSTNGSVVAGSAQGLADVVIARFGRDGKQQFVKQFGTSGDDQLNAVTVDPSGQAYAVGSTRGAFPGQVQAGGQDGILIRFGTDGNRTLTRQIGTSYADNLSAIAFVGGQIYTAGSTRGAFPGQSQNGIQDGLIVRLQPEGTISWLNQFGTTQSDSATGIAAWNGTIFVGGTTFGDFETGATLMESDGFLQSYQLE